MSNSLLDFVMALVRDPDVAKQYAADPVRAIADAGLTDVGTADVDQLIPLVSESSAAAPAVEGNVWASGAATAAFDAFGIDDGLPVSVADLQDIDVPVIVDAAADGVDRGGAPEDVFDTPLVDNTMSDNTMSDGAVIDDLPLVDEVFDAGVADWPGTEQPVDPAQPNFDLFD